MSYLEPVACECPCQCSNLGFADDDEDIPTLCHDCYWDIHMGDF